MGFLSELENIKKRIFILGFLDLLLFITPGLSFIFIFDRELFVSLDTIKLILLAACFIAPIVFTNLLIFITWMDDPDTLEENMFADLSGAILMSGIITFAVLPVSYFAHLSYSQISFIFAALETIIFISTIIYVYAQKRKKPK